MQEVTQGDRGSHIYMQRGRRQYTALSHGYMPSKRYCSFCLFGKHLSRDVTPAADKDSDLCIISSVNTSHAARLYNIKDKYLYLPLTHQRTLFPQQQFYDISDGIKHMRGGLN